MVSDDAVEDVDLSVADLRTATKRLARSVSVIARSPIQSITGAVLLAGVLKERLG